MRQVLVLALVACVLAIVPRGTLAGEPRLGTVTNLPVPRYVSLRSDRINVRRGPGLDYRKDWVFQREGLPVRVIDEYGDWRRIVDHDDASGWIYHAMITGRRTVLITEDRTVFRREPTDTAPATAEAEQGVIASLRRCGPDWCEVEKDGHVGWVRKKAVWGVDDDEVTEE